MCRTLLWNIPERRYNDGMWGYGLDPCGSGQDALLVTANAVTKRRVLQASWATIRFSMETLLCTSVNETDKQTNKHKQPKCIRGFRFSWMLRGVCSTDVSGSTSVPYWRAKQSEQLSSQRCLTADWLAPRENGCSRMHGKVSSDWLPSYIKAKRPVLDIFKMAGYFPDSPRTPYDCYGGNSRPTEPTP